ncbi:MAG: hypothetical protein LBM75_04770 [Myxococcales bacterium]|nr:hypothetical protein [Myxococcales bacterium]
MAGEIRPKAPFYLLVLLIVAALVSFSLHQAGILPWPMDEAEQAQTLSREAHAVKEKAKATTAVTGGSGDATPKAQPLEGP